MFTAGQGGFGDDGTVVSDDPVTQIRQAFANVDLALQAGGASLDTIVKMTVFLADAGLYDAFKTGARRAVLAALPGQHRAGGRRLPVRRHAGRDRGGRAGGRGPEGSDPEGSDPGLLA